MRKWWDETDWDFLPGGNYKEGGKNWKRGEKKRLRNEPEREGERDFAERYKKDITMERDGFFHLTLQILQYSKRRKNVETKMLDGSSNAYEVKLHEYRQTW